MTEEEYLKTYNPNKYEKPSVTTDILIFTVNENHELELLLIKRGGHPYKGKWAIPGGFVNMTESLDDGARRELKEETGLSGDYHLEQLYTFGGVNRDPRMRVISVAYMALIPKPALLPRAGDDAAEAMFFRVSINDRELQLVGENKTLLTAKDLTFDHEEIIRTAWKRLAGKLDYTDLAFEFLNNKNDFTLGELRGIYECIKGQTIDAGNFAKMFKSKYLNTGIVSVITEEKESSSKTAPKHYHYTR